MQNRWYMCIHWTRVLYSVVITQQSNPPISQFNSLYNEFTSFWSMFIYNTHVTPYVIKSINILTIPLFKISSYDWWQIFVTAASVNVIFLRSINPNIDLSVYKPVHESNTWACIRACTRACTRAYTRAYTQAYIHVLV